MEIKKLAIGLGIAGAIGGVIGAFILLSRAKEAFAQSVYEEVGTGLWPGSQADPLIQSFLTIDPLYDGTGVYALGAPDGLPAVLRGYEGNYLTLALFARPKHVETLKLHLMNLYDRIIDPTFMVDVSADGLSWIEVWDPRIEIPVGTSIYEIPVNQSIAFARIRQWREGVNQGIDSIK